MVEPINPQDHSIGVGECKYELDERFSFDEWHMAALAEAIHQTFERDAMDAAPVTAERGSYVGRRADPATEIDRIARLIVDGEYRRRSEQENQA